MSDKVITSPWLNELTAGSYFEGFYVIQDASLQTAINGKPYIRMTISDASGSILANMWDANPEIYKNCIKGQAIKIQAAAENYKGKIQAKVVKLRPALSAEIDSSKFISYSKYPIDVMQKDFFIFISSITDSDYKRLAEAFFTDEKIFSAFSLSPAAKEVHHAWLGGLLEHTLSICRLADNFSISAPVNRDLLLIGAMLHDIGKIEELSAKLSIEYTDRGKLLGHLIIGSIMAEEKAKSLANFPEDKLWLVQHLILSHHGKYEYGSPVLPKTPEAIALHYLDNIDAKTEAARRLIESSTDPASKWTDRSWLLETSLYKNTLSGQDYNEQVN